MGTGRGDGCQRHIQVKQKQKMGGSHIRQPFIIQNVQLKKNLGLTHSKMHYFYTWYIYMYVN